MTLRELIAEQLNLTGVSPAEQEVFLVRLEDAILRQTTLEVLDRLPENDRLELEKLISEKDDNTILGFIRSKLSDFDNLQKQVTDEILKKFLA